jgi:Ca2+/H+ antiporter, TMEM165/GDT1 family
MTRWIRRILMVLFFGTLAVFVFGEIVLHLWNWLMPALFHLPAVTFWQALGLLVLSWLLFGGLRGHRGGGPGNWRWRMQGRWEKMTPEEREKFREWRERRCGGFAAGSEGSGKA